LAKRSPDIARIPDFLQPQNSYILWLCLATYISHILGSRTCRRALRAVKGQNDRDTASASKTTPRPLTCDPAEPAELAANDQTTEPIANRWLIHFSDREPLELILTDPATRAEILERYPIAVATEPFSRPSRAATADETSELRKLISTVQAGDFEGQRAALAVGARQRRRGVGLLQGARRGPQAARLAGIGATNRTTEGCVECHDLEPLLGLHGRLPEDRGATCAAWTRIRMVANWNGLLGRLQAELLTAGIVLPDQPVIDGRWHLCADGAYVMFVQMPYLAGDRLDAHMHCEFARSPVLTARGWWCGFTTLTAASTVAFDRPESVADSTGRCPRGILRQRPLTT
jgi:hypothetical protein